MKAGEIGGGAVRMGCSGGGAMVVFYIGGGALISHRGIQHYILERRLTLVEYKTPPPPLSKLLQLTRLSHWLINAPAEPN